MAVAALVTWLLTATGGFIMLGTWLARGGHRPEGRSRITPGLVFSHFGLAVTGLVIWIIYLATDATALRWIAFALLLLVALLGFTMFGRWLGSRREQTAESRFPVAVVYLHGLLAAATLVLVFLVSIGL